jgi:hypothetical protein
MCLCVSVFACAFAHACVFLCACNKGSSVCRGVRILGEVILSTRLSPHALVQGSSYLALDSGQDEEATKPSARRTGTAPCSVSCVRRGALACVSAWLLRSEQVKTFHLDLWQQSISTQTHMKTII